MKSPLLALVAALVLGAPSLAVAQPAPGGPLPYAPWDGRSEIPPPAAEPERAPRPLERAPEFARRTVELGPDLGVALPSCAGRVDRGAPCAALGPGLFLGLSALYRPGPYFAFGGGLSAADFGARAGMTPEQASGRLLEASAVARVYMLESGRMEPYLELWIGAGTQKSAAAPFGAPRFEQHSVGAGGRVGGGIDFYLGEHLRLGPAIGALRFWSLSSERCEAGSRCRASTLEQQGQLMGAYLLSLHVSVNLGSRH